MDNQQLETLKTLQSLYKFLLENPKTHITDLCFFLNISTQPVIQLLSKLSAMGLNIQQGSKNVSLSNVIDPIDIKKIKLKLIQAQIDKPLHYSFSTPSTSQLARKNTKPSLYLSEHQSSGRGRQDRKWLTPLGQSIALSINHKFKLALKDLSGLNIAIAVAIVNAANKCGNKQLTLKWPNDVLKDSAKVAGILLEASGNNQQSTVIIGIGINWNLRDTLLKSIPQECTNIGIKNLNRSEFIVVLIVEIEKIIIEFSNNKLKNILPKWTQSDAYINKDINIIQGLDKYQGKYIGVSANGALQVLVNNEIKTLASGEVSIRKVDYSEK